MTPELFANHKYPIMNVKQFPHTSGTQWQTQSNESGKITENLSASFKIDSRWVKLDSVIRSYQSKQVCGEYQQSRNWQFKIGVRIIVAAGAAAGVQICDCLPKSTPPTACQVWSEVTCWPKLDQQSQSISALRKNWDLPGKCFDNFDSPIKLKL